MSGATWLIAGREFRAYAATATFWVALALGPLLVGTLGAFGASGGAERAQAALTLSREPTGDVEVRFSRNFPLSEAARQDVVEILSREMAGEVRVASGGPGAAGSAGKVALPQLFLVMMLWITLTGSLGMLLQAVVRERANRALESLMAGASRWDIIAGKLLGVGAVSIIVVATWLVSCVLFVGLVPANAGVFGAILQQVAQPALLLRACAIYILAFAFYGLVTIAIGAMARDNADAQNLARPMFAVLLMVFFAAFATAGGVGSMSWLVYVAPFTPFMLLAAPQAPGVELPAIALLAVATVVAGALAARVLTLEPGFLRFRRLPKAKLQ